MFCMSTARARVDRAGRILIPAKLRAELSVRPGDPVVLETMGHELRVRPYREAIREAQAIIRKYIPDREHPVVAELIAEARNEAKRE
jgi:AbrB family looped-hinge helix DNA binding protein